MVAVSHFRPSTETYLRFPLAFTTHACGHSVSHCKNINTLQLKSVCYSSDALILSHKYYGKSEYRSYRNSGQPQDKPRGSPGGTSSGWDQSQVLLEAFLPYPRAQHHDAAEAQGLHRQSDHEPKLLICDLHHTLATHLATKTLYLTPSLSI